MTLVSYTTSPIISLLFIRYYIIRWSKQKFARFDLSFYLRCPRVTFITLHEFIYLLLHDLFAFHSYIGSPIYFLLYHIKRRVFLWKWLKIFGCFTCSWPCFVLVIQLSSKFDSHVRSFRSMAILWFSYGLGAIETIRWKRGHLLHLRIIQGDNT